MKQGMIILSVSLLLPCPGAIAATLVGLWEFNEGTGDVVRDATSNHCDGSIVYYAGSPTWGAGHLSFTNAAESAGQSRVEVSGMPSFSTYGSFSIVTRFRITVDNGDHQDVACKFGSGTASDDEWRIGVYRINGLYRPHFQVCNASGSPDVIDPDPISLNQWHTMTGVFRSGEGVDIFLDGILKGSLATSILTCRTTSQPVWFGNQHHWSSNWEPMYGDIDYIRIYEGAIPEPATLALLALGGLTWFRRRRVSLSFINPACLNV